MHTKKLNSPATIVTGRKKMSVALTLTTHAEKLAFVRDYLYGHLDDFPRNRPLMILGSGGNGKTHVINLAMNTSIVNVMLLYPGNGYKFYPAEIILDEHSDECVILIHANGTPEDFALAASLNANIVEFKSDPAFQQS